MIFSLAVSFPDHVVKSHWFGGQVLHCLQQCPRLYILIPLNWGSLEKTVTEVSVLDLFWPQEGFILVLSDKLFLPQLNLLFPMNLPIFFQLPFSTTSNCFWEHPKVCSVSAPYCKWSPFLCEEIRRYLFSGPSPRQHPGLWSWELGTAIPPL